MAINKSEPNAQNSELDPKVHPSGARIDSMMKKADEARRGNERATSSNLATDDQEPGQEAGTFGDSLRDSEKPSAYAPANDTAEGGRSQVSDRQSRAEKGDGHRSSPDDREV